jgi:Ca2+-binding EF-hand superfamily protein
MIRRVTAAAVLFGVLPALLPAGPPPASQYEIAYFGLDGPARLRLLVSIDGRPADAVWQEAMDALFAFCDRNGDGELDATEQTILAPPRRGRDAQLQAIEANAPPLRLNFAAKAGKVTRAEFAAAVRDAGYGPVGLAVVRTRANADQISAALFRHLDQDGDGKLSPGELKAARDRLAFLDVNEDELLTPAELLGRGTATPAQDVRAAQGDQADSLPELRLLAGDPEAMAKQLLLPRGTSRATPPRRADLGADDKTFGALDTNRDGRLDAAELEQWLRQPADWECELAFGPRNGPAWPSPPRSPGDRMRSRVEPGGTAEAFLKLARFRFEPPADDSGSGRADRLRDRLKSLVDDKGTLTKPSPDLAAFSTAVDRNGDDRVDAAEIAAALGVIARLDRCRVIVTAQDHGNGLFELLDRNGDGRLAPRELVEAADTLRPFADGAGRVGPADLPRRFDVRAAVGMIPALVLTDAPPRERDATQVKPATSNIPEWFRLMDRNDDGDVSLREFLGPLELFRKLDRDGDGLISAQEAAAFGAVGPPINRRQVRSSASEWNNGCLSPSQR